MTYEMYQTIFWHAGVLTIIFAVGDVLLFVTLKIQQEIGQLRKTKGPERGPQCGQQTGREREGVHIDSPYEG